MGATCVSERKKTSWNINGDDEPADTNSLASSAASLPPLDFEMKISNLKLKGVNYGTSISVGFVSPEIALDLKLPAQDPILNAEPHSAKWLFEQRKSFRMNEWKLRKTFLYIYVKNHDQKVAQLQLNLFLVATGPYHLDFPIRYQNKSSGRICLDVRISQLVAIRSSTNSVTVTLIKERPGETFNFSLKTICNSLKQFDSEHSYNQKLSLEQTLRQELQPYRTGNQKPTMNKQITQSTIDEMHKVYWSNEQVPLPALSPSISTSDMHSASLQFLMWLVEDKPTKQDGETEQTYRLCGECYISFNRIVQRDFKEIEMEGTTFQRRQLDMTEKIWNRGKLIGEVRICMTVDIPQFFKQMVVYVRSEEGIQTITPFIGKASGKGQVCSQIAELLTIQTRIQQTLTQLTSMNSSGKMPQIKIKLVRQEIYEQLCRLLQILEFSNKESIKIYTYSSEKDLLRGQQALVEIGFKLAECIEEDDSTLHDICWKCLITLMKRAELTLRCLGFSEQEKKELLSRKLGNFTKKRLELGLKVQKFFYHMLGIVLTCLSKKALPDNERMFVESFCAYSYFRIPEFRSRIIGIISRPEDADSSDNLVVQPNGQSLPSSDESKTLDLLFNWDENFYKPISFDERYQANLNELLQLLEVKEWMHRMEKRGVAFFYFVVYWVSYVEQTLVKSDRVKWHYLPCYNQLINACLAEMRRRPLTAYPDSLRDASTKLLANQKLLNRMVVIIFEKTNKYDCVTVLKCIEILNDYFRFLSETKRSIPNTFNYSYFLTGIWPILENENSFALAKCLQMIYDNFNLFSLSCRRDITFFLLGRAFFNMFLNWSHNVRVVFHHLLMFRIYLQSKVLPSGLKQTSSDEMSYHQLAYRHNQHNEQVRRRYQTLMLMLDNCIKLKEQQLSRKFATDYEKDYAKRMRKKMAERRKNARQTNHEQLTSLHRKEQPTVYKIVPRQAEKPAQRYRSEVVSSVTISYPQEFLHQKEVFDITHSPPRNVDLSLRKMSQSSELSTIKKIGPYDQVFEVAQVQNDQLSYLSVAIAEFKAIEEKYMKKYSKCNEKDKVPRLQVKVPIDEAQTRPEIIDEW